MFVILLGGKRNLHKYWTEPDNEVVAQVVRGFCLSIVILQSL